MSAESGEWEGRLVEQETKLTDVMSARAALESALTVQLRALAAGRLADRLLSKQPVSELVWWRHYQSAADGPTQLRPDPDHAGFREFQQQFLESLVQRRVRRVTRSDFAKATLRIYGGRVPVWKEGRVNRQLADLGSSLRLFIVNAERTRRSAIRAKLDGAAGAAWMDGRFLFGEVGPCTACSVSVLFDFTRELAVSPDLEHVTPGFTEGKRIVIRAATHHMAFDVELRQRMDQLWAKVGLRPEEIEDSYRNAWQAALGHELGHVLFEAIAPMTPGSLGSWRAGSREDLCRFARVRRTLQEIVDAFGFFFSTTERSARLVTGDSLPYWGQLDQMLQALIQEGLLVVLDGVALQCPLFEDHRPWQLV